MKSTYSLACETKYPEYYVLDIGDIVEQFIQDWHDIVASQVAVETLTPGNAEPVYPEVYTIDPETGECHKQVYVAQHYSVVKERWYPDVSLIIHHVIEAVKTNAEESDVELNLQLLEYDVAVMAHHHLAPNISQPNMPMVYTDTSMQVAKLAATFGRQLLQRLMQFNMHRDGHFPYHFAGWQDSCAIVALDDTHR